LGTKVQNGWDENANPLERGRLPLSRAARKPPKAAPSKGYRENNVTQRILEWKPLGPDSEASAPPEPP